MWKDALHRAWRDTTSALGGWQVTLGIVVMPLMGFAAHYWRDGANAMSAEAYIWAIYGLSPLVALFVLIFVWNLACAPYRIEKEKRTSLEA